MNIIISPFNVESNQYINRTKEVFISMGYTVSPMKMKSVFQRNNNIFVCNWVEDNVSGRGIKLYVGLLRALIKIGFGKLAAKQFIWIRHNLKPHYGSNKNFFYQLVLRILKRVSNDICCHAEYIADSHYVPHPLYALEKEVSEAKFAPRDKEFVFFGHISRYKGIVELLQAWPQDKSLELYGKCESSALEVQINDIINLRKLSIKPNYGFISDVQLNEILQRVKYIVLPHASESMIVSGAFYHAISYGANIIVRDNKFGKEISKRHAFCTCFNLDNITSVINKLAYVEPRHVKQDAKKHYGIEQLQKLWSNVFI